ncbi:MAG: 2-dehydropantoate 2-reductase [Opitutaceae bacterium]
MARIAIVGPGAIGGVMAAWLEHTGKHTLTLCARRHLGEIIVETPTKTMVARPTVVLDPAFAPPVDWVFVATKTYDSAASAAWFGRLRAEGAAVAVLQNGVEHIERFAPYVPAEKILPVLLYCPAERVSPTIIRQRRAARIEVPDNPAGRAFAMLFDGTEIAVAPTEDFTSALWRKLCVNVVGVLNALLLRPAGVLREPQIAELARSLMRECIAVGRAEGAVLGDALADEVLDLYARTPGDSVNSLQADRAAGRPMEIEARNGVIVRLGRKHGIATPYNQMAVALLEGAVGAGVEAKEKTDPHGRPALQGGVRASG